MNRNWLAMEHYRMHVIETWPEGPKKQASLAAVRATLENLRRLGPEAQRYVCIQCHEAAPDHR